MNFFNKLFKTNKLNEIFTPNTTAKLTYVKRDNIEEDLEKYLDLPGKQIVLYGHSGSGKTTLLRNKLKEVNYNFIKTHCESNTTFNEILLQAFDELNRFYISEKTTNSSYSISSEIKTEFKIIGSKINEQQQNSEGNKSIRLLPPQLTPQKLAAFLGEIDCVWVIEDFHKVKQEEKLRIADVIKIFIDSANDFPKVKIVCIGAVGTARELIELDNNLNNRVAELHIPLLTENEIKGIINKGFDLMNTSISSDLKDKIVYYSNNLGSITHQICYDICYHSAIRKSSFFPKSLKDSSFKNAINSYVKKNSDTFSKIYDTILCQTYGWNVLKTFETLEKDYLTINEILEKIPVTKKPNEEELFEYLGQLGSAEYKEIIRFDKDSNKYSISSPFFKAFLNMKFALEQSELNERNRKKKNKRSQKYLIDAPVRETIFTVDEDFLVSYNEILDRLIENEFKLRKLRK
jgi:hypothetical protein